jgi:hypothetical protein
MRIELKNHDADSHVAKLEFALAHCQFFNLKWNLDEDHYSEKGYCHFNSSQPFAHPRHPYINHDGKCKGSTTPFNPYSLPINLGSEGKGKRDRTGDHSFPDN